ncbi:hypothetical protein L1887_55072 [Cichorium endivia]|nr:hypothetical protein L1887_55072 [Cichorium endivia]
MFLGSARPSWALDFSPRMMMAGPSEELAVAGGGTELLELGLGALCDGGVDTAAQTLVGGDDDEELAATLGSDGLGVLEDLCGAERSGSGEDGDVEAWSVGWRACGWRRLHLPLLASPGGCKGGVQVGPRDAGWECWLYGARQLAERGRDAMVTYLGDLFDVLDRLDALFGLAERGGLGGGRVESGAGGDGDGGGRVDGGHGGARGARKHSHCERDATAVGDDEEVVMVMKCRCDLPFDFKAAAQRVERPTDWPLLLSASVPALPSLPFEAGGE